MPERERLRPELIREMAALHGIHLDPQRLANQAKDLQNNIDKLGQVSQEELTDIEPAFVRPLRLPIRRRAR